MCAVAISEPVAAAYVQDLVFSASVAGNAINIVVGSAQHHPIRCLKPVDPTRALVFTGLSAVASSRITFWAAYLYHIDLSIPDAFVYGLGETLMDVVYAGGSLFFGSQPFGSILDYVGLGMFCLGSFIETYSDLTRKIWKEDKNNVGKYYGKGLNAIVQHPNYFGFLLYRTGLGFLTGSWQFGLFFCAFYFMWFHFGSIPDLQERNRRKYPGYDNYIKQTYKMIPFLY